MCECSWIICSISLGKIERVLFISFHFADHLNQKYRSVSLMLFQKRFQETKTGLEHMVIHLGNKKKKKKPSKKLYCVTLFTLLCLHTTYFCSVFMSFACCDLLLITRCSCISKSTFLSIERGKAVNWALWECGCLWSWGDVKIYSGFLWPRELVACLHQFAYNTNELLINCKKADQC